MTLSQAVFPNAPPKVCLMSVFLKLQYLLALLIFQYSAFEIYLKYLVEQAVYWCGF